MTDTQYTVTVRGKRADNRDNLYSLEAIVTKWLHFIETLEKLFDVWNENNELNNCIKDIQRAHTPI